MDIATLVQKIYDLVSAVRNGNYLSAIMLTLELIRIISAVLPQSTLAAPRGGMRASFYSDKSLDQLCTELDDCCKLAPPQPLGTTVAVGSATTETFIDTVLPILVSLIKKLLGV